MHDTQKTILKRLLQENGQKYAALTRGYTYEDNVVFHLKQLLSGGLIEKPDGVYSITAKGVKNITKYDLTGLTDTGFKTLFLGFLCNHEAKYLVKEHPQGISNFYNLPSGKPHFGEKIDDGLVRTFTENTKLTLPSINFSFACLHLKTIKTSAGEVLFDDAFAIYKVTLNEAQYHKAELSPAFHWMSKDEVKDLPNRWPELDICILKNNLEPYLVYEFVSDYILDLYNLPPITAISLSGAIRIQSCF